MSKKHGPEPFYRPRRKRWYVEINGKHINLGPDEDQAKVCWHQIMGGAVPITATDPATSPSTSVLVCLTITVRPGPPSGITPTFSRSSIPSPTRPP